MCFLYAWDHRHDDRILVHSRYRLSVGNGRSFHADCFFIYGPQALLGIAMSNQATKEASATANGILGVFGYASTLISGVGLGFIADRYGWNSIYAVILVFAVLGLLTLTTIWKAAPDGYGAAKNSQPNTKGIRVDNFFIFVCLHTIIPENRCRWIPNTN